MLADLPINDGWGRWLAELLVPRRSLILLLTHYVPLGIMLYRAYQAMIVRFYQSSSGRKVVKEFIDSLSVSMQEEFYDALARLSMGEVLSMPVSRNLGGVCKGLSELRFRDPRGAYRVFYYVVKDEAIYLLHAFKKKSQKTPLKEIRLAMKRIKEI